MSPSDGMASPQDVEDPLDLTSLDSDSLFTALTAVEKAVPDLLLDLKPILAHLSSPFPAAESSASAEARDALAHYVDTLDKIQYVLRQTTYYLRETKASPATLRPPPPDNIPRPFASTLPSARSASNGEQEDLPGENEVELGLYASRLEAKALKDISKALRVLRAQQDGSNPTGTAGTGAGHAQQEIDTPG